MQLQSTCKIYQTGQRSQVMSLRSAKVDPDHIAAVRHCLYQYHSVGGTYVPSEGTRLLLTRARVIPSRDHRGR